MLARILCLAALATVGALADEAPAREYPPFSNVFFDTDVRQALSDLAAQTGAIIIPDESVQGFVTLELKEAPLERALDLILLAGGYVWAEVEEGVYLVTSLDPSLPSFARIAVTEPFSLLHLRPDEVLPLLSELFARLVKVDPASERLILTAPPRLLEKIREAIRALDVQRPAVQAPSTRTEVIDVSLLEIPGLAALLPPAFSELVQIDEAGGRLLVTGSASRIAEVRAWVEALDHRQVVARVVALEQASGPELVALLPPALAAFVRAHESCDRVVIVAPERLAAAVEAEVRRLDGLLTDEGRTTELVELNYIDSEEVGSLLPEAMKPLVTFDTLGNRCLVTGRPRLVAQAAAQIRAMDVPPLQLLLEALVVDVSRADMEAFEIAARDHPVGIDTGTGIITYVDAAEAVLYRLLWLVQHDKARVLASPRVVTQEGREAMFSVQLEQYFELTSGRVGFEYVNLEVIEAPISLTIKPRVARDDGQVTCEIKPEVADVIGQGANDLPIITRRTAQTTIRVGDGQPIAIGGLLQQMEREIRRKIPLLGDLPIIGGLFRSRETQQQDREVVILVVPHVLGDDGQYAGSLIFDRAGELTGEPDGQAGPAPTVAGAGVRPRGRVSDHRLP